MVEMKEIPISEWPEEDREQVLNLLQWSANRCVQAAKEAMEQSDIKFTEEELEEMGKIDV